MFFLKNKRFFDINMSLLKLAGLWVPDQGESLPLQIWYLIYNIAINGFALLFFMPCEFVAFQSSRKDFEELIKNASVAFTHLLGMIKCCVWLNSRKVILKMIEDLEAKVSDYDEIDDFQPQVMIETEKSTKNFTLTVFFSICCSVSLTALSGSTAILLTDYERFEVFDLDANNSTIYRYTQPLPYFVWMPFNAEASKIHFFIGVLYVCYPALTQAWTIAGTDTLFTALVSYTSVQLRILQGAFKTIRARCIRNLNLKDEQLTFYDSPELNDAMMKEMNKCVKHLQIIFKTCEKMESIYTYLTLTQVLMSEILICTCLYLVSSIPMTSKAFATELVYLVAIEFQIALYCFFGNKVTETANGISMALYEGDWLSSSASFKKSMLITMTRMKKPIYLTMGKFSPLTLSTFVTIARGSYSFFAVLKNNNIEE
nr:odorant receptor 44 [Podabrus annulatus]